MKIALVSPYDFAYPGGVVNHIASLERHLTRMGHEVKVIAPASKAVISFGDRFIPIGRPRPIPSSGSILRITISLRLASSIKAILEKEKFDIVHLHEPFMPMLCSSVLRFSDVPNIGTFHACDGKPDQRLHQPGGGLLGGVLQQWHSDRCQGDERYVKQLRCLPAESLGWWRVG